MTPGLGERLKRRRLFLKDVPAWSRILYDALFYVFSVFYLPSFILKGKWREGFGTRFGRIDAATRDRLRARIFWVHAVSVGEVVQAMRLINAVRDSMSEFKFLLTTTTATGREVALKLKGESDEVLYFPVDYRWSVRAFIRAVNPEALVLLETEIWPNLILELSDRGVPVFIVNGRISEKAIGKYRSIRRFLAPILNRLSAIAVQDETMKERFLELGADVSVVKVTGNMKFDWLPTAVNDPVYAKIESFRAGADFFWMAGSTHAGEEELLLRVYNILLRRYPKQRLLIAPRHLTRVESILQEAAKKGFKVIKISEWDGSQTGVLLLDKMGLLAGAYAYADAVFVGGSLAPFGGHNLVEPAYFEKPILFGPHMNNFRSMSQDFLRASAAIQVENAEALEGELVSLADNPAERKRLGSRAKTLILTHQGATERNKQLLMNSMALID